MALVAKLDLELFEQVVLLHTRWRMNMLPATLHPLQQYGLRTLLRSKKISESIGHVNLFCNNTSCTTSQSLIKHGAKVKRVSKAKAQ